MFQDQYNANPRLSHESGASRCATSNCESQPKIEALCQVEQSQPENSLNNEHRSTTFDSSVSQTEILINGAEDLLQLPADVADKVSGQTSPTAWIEGWMEQVVPVLKQGGKPVAIILALGVISIPLQLLGASLWTPLILAIAALIVVIRVPL